MLTGSFSAPNVWKNERSFPASDNLVSFNMLLRGILTIVALLPWVWPTLLVSRAVAVETRVIFNKNFEGGALGKIEKLAETRFRCFVEGQCDEHGRNRQANWYYFRMDGVQNREVTLTLTDFVG